MTAQITVPTGFVLREPAAGTLAWCVLPWRLGFCRAVRASGRFVDAATNCPAAKAQGILGHAESLGLV
jgi:hypothetical protein